MISKPNYIVNRTTIQFNKDTLYLFGDNLVRKGLGGQAKEMRGEPNTIGIRTKKYPSNLEGSFLEDIDLDYNKILITQDIDLAIKKYQEGNYKHLTIPPMGTGLAKLDTNAPNTFHWLSRELDRLTLEVLALEKAKRPLFPVDPNIHLEDFPSDSADFSTTDCIDLY